MTGSERTETSESRHNEEELHAPATSRSGTLAPSRHLMETQLGFVRRSLGKSQSSSIHHVNLAIKDHSSKSIADVASQRTAGTVPLYWIAHVLLNKNRASLQVCVLHDPQQKHRTLKPPHASWAAVSRARCRPKLV